MAKKPEIETKVNLPNFNELRTEMTTCRPVFYEKLVSDFSTALFSIQRFASSTVALMKHNSSGDIDAFIGKCVSTLGTIANGITTVHTSSAPKQDHSPKTFDAIEKDLMSIVNDETRFYPPLAENARKEIALLIECGREMTKERPTVADPQSGDAFYLAEVRNEITRIRENIVKLRELTEKTNGEIAGVHQGTERLTADIAKMREAKNTLGDSAKGAVSQSTESGDSMQNTLSQSTEFSDLSQSAALQSMESSDSVQGASSQSSDSST